MTTTHGRTGAGTRAVRRRAATRRALCRQRRRQRWKAAQRNAPATGAIDAAVGRSRVQVTSGAAAMTASAAQASKYRAFGPAERAIHLRDCRIHRSDQDALPEEVEQRPA